MGGRVAIALRHARRLAGPHAGADFEHRPEREPAGRADADAAADTDGHVDTVRGPARDGDGRAGRRRGDGAERDAGRLGDSHCDALTPPHTTTTREDPMATQPQTTQHLAAARELLDEVTNAS